MKLLFTALPWNLTGIPPGEAGGRSPERCDSGPMHPHRTRL